VRRKLAIDKGSDVTSIETENGISVSPQEVLPMDALDRLWGLSRNEASPLKN
jgi:hypothetical protein